MRAFTYALVIFNWIWNQILAGDGPSQPWPACESRHAIILLSVSKIATSILLAFTRIAFTSQRSLDLYTYTVIEGQPHSW